MSVSVEEGAPDVAESQVGAFPGRKEKRKALKKLKRKEIRRELAIKEREEEEALANDPEEQLRIRLREQEEQEAAERERKAFEESERFWLQTLATRRAEQEEETRRKRLLEEESCEDEVKDTDDFGGGDDWEYVEEGPAEIIWKGNEIIVKKKRIRVPKRLDQEEDERPTSNPLPPQSIAFDASKTLPPVSAQEMLDNVAHQVPNFGTEQDKAHCPFHLKTGACRFGARCSRVHFYPDKSCTLLIKNMYNGPGLAWDQDEGLEYTDEEVERCYEEFYEDVHTEFLKFGELINFKVCRNSSSHLRGNVYIHYKNLESSILAYNAMNGRYYAGKQITCEFVTISRWKIAICGEFMKSRLKTCSRGTACNFIHCFHNPGGDYEWADWDNPPPKYWIRKMAVLFGTSNELRHDVELELDNWRLPRELIKEQTQDRDRYNRRRARHSEAGPSSSSDGDDSDGDGNQHSSRRRRSDFPTKWGRSERSRSRQDDHSRRSRHPHNSDANIPKRHRDRVSSRWEKETKERSHPEDDERRTRKHRRPEKVPSERGYKCHDHPERHTLLYLDDGGQIINDGYHRDRH